MRLVVKPTRQLPRAGGVRGLLSPRTYKTDYTYGIHVKSSVTVTAASPMQAIHRSKEKITEELYPVVFSEYRFEPAVKSSHQRDEDDEGVLEWLFNKIKGKVGESPQKWSQEDLDVRRNIDREPMTVWKGNEWYLAVTVYRRFLTGDPDLCVGTVFVEGESPDDVITKFISKKEPLVSFVKDDVRRRVNKADAR